GDEDRRIPGGVNLGSAPGFLPGHFVQRDQGVALDAGVDNKKVLVEHRRGARAPAIDALADLGVPELLAVEVEAVDSRLAAEDVEALAIDERGAGGVPVVGTFAVVFVFGQDRLEFPGPQDIAPGPIDADEMALEILHVARLLGVQRVAGIGGDEKPVALSYRA